MSFFKNQHYLLKTRTGDLLDVYMANSVVVCKNYHQGYTSPPTASILVNEQVIDLDARIDASDNLHIVCITRDGSLKYYMGQTGKGLNSTRLTGFDLKARHYRYVTLLLAGKRVHLFWMTASIMNSFLWGILHSFWDGKEWHEQQVGEIIAGKHIPQFVVDRDSQENVHMMFTSIMGGKQYEPFYKRFNNNFNLWSHTERISGMPENTLSVVAIVDRFDNLHLLSNGSGGDNPTQISYRSRKNLTRPSSQWGPVITLSKSLNNTSQPFLVCSDNNIVAFWKEQNNFVRCRSEDQGATWKKPVNISFAGRTVAMSYYTNSAPEAGSKKAPFLIGVSDPHLVMVIDELADIVPRQAAPGEALSGIVPAAEHYSPDKGAFQEADRQNMAKDKEQPPQGEEKIKPAALEESDQLAARAAEMTQPAPEDVLTGAPSGEIAVICEPEKESSRTAPVDGRPEVVNEEEAVVSHAGVSAAGSDAASLLGEMAEIRSVLKEILSGNQHFFEIIEAIGGIQAELQGGYQELKDIVQGMAERLQAAREHTEGAEQGLDKRICNLEVQLETGLSGLADDIAGNAREMEELVTVVGSIGNGLAAVKGQVKKIETSAGENRELFKDAQAGIESRLEIFTKELKDVRKEVMYVQQIHTGIKTELEKSARESEEKCLQRDKEVKDLHQNLKQLNKGFDGLLSKYNLVREAQEQNSVAQVAREKEVGIEWEVRTRDMEAKIQVLADRYREIADQTKVLLEKHKATSLGIDNVESQCRQLLKHVESIEKSQQVIKEEMERQKNAGFLKKLFSSE